MLTISTKEAHTSSIMTKFHSPKNQASDQELEASSGGLPWKAIFRGVGKVLNHGGNAASAVDLGIHLAGDGKKDS